jgi:putative acetyltransferase
MRALLSLADDREEPVVVLLGAPGYYRRFGFALASTYGITPPDPAWAPHFQARPGPTFSPSLRGAFTYAEPFDRV